MPPREPRKAFRLGARPSLRRQHQLSPQIIGRDGNEGWLSECWPLWLLRRADLWSAHRLCHSIKDKKRKNLSSARHYDQIRFRFHTAKTQLGHLPSMLPQMCSFVGTPMPPHSFGWNGRTGENAWEETRRRRACLNRNGMMSWSLAVGLVASL